MDLGTSLRQARERSGLSVADVAARTKIPIRTLSALEENDFTRIPAGPYARAFIRIYAREVGLDPSEAVDAYGAATEPAEPVGPEVVPEAPEPVRRRWVIPALTESPAWSYSIVAVVLLVGFMALNRSPNPETPANAAPPAVAASGSLTGQPETVATTGSGIEVEMHARGLCWVMAVVDGEPTFTRLMQPGERQTLTGERDVVLRIGDPGAFSYTVNGKPGEPLGAPKVPVTVRLGADGQIARS